MSYYLRQLLAERIPTIEYFQSSMHLNSKTTSQFSEAAYLRYICRYMFADIDCTVTWVRSFNGPSRVGVLHLFT
jgi:hypothetical protein